MDNQQVSFYGILQFSADHLADTILKFLEESYFYQDVKIQHQLAFSDSTIYASI